MSMLIPSMTDKMMIMRMRSNQYGNALNNKIQQENEHKEEWCALKDQQTAQQNQWAPFPDEGRLARKSTTPPTATAGATKDVCKNARERRLNRKLAGTRFVIMRTKSGFLLRTMRKPIVKVNLSTYMHSIFTFGLSTRVRMLPAHQSACAHGRARTERERRWAPPRKKRRRGNLREITTPFYYASSSQIRRGLPGIAEAEPCWARHSEEC